MILNELNDEQREAVMTTEGFVRVIAGAGSGKTRALTHRCAFLINELGILPENILCVTFTNKAAGEMRARIRNLVGDNDTAFINTFHGFCVAVLREDSNAVQYPKSFIVLDNSDIDAMLRLIYEERGLTLRDKTFSDARDMIEIQKLFKKPYYADDLIAETADALRAKYDAAESVDDIIFYGYLYQEKKTFALDYNDLIIFVLRIFARDEAIRLKWQSRLEYIMIDEFQDIDALQYELMEVLCAHHRNLFIVGDPDQTIYTWRGANVKYILDFDKQFENVHTVRMLKNYRSVPPVIAAANSLIAKNSRRIRKDLIPVRAGGEPVRFCFAKNAADEAMAVVKRVRSLHDQKIDTINIDTVLKSGFNSFTLEKARETVKDFTEYLEQHKDEILALSIFYNQPYNRRNLTLKMVQELLEKLKQDKPLLAPTYVWDAYCAIENVKAAQPKAELTALVSLVRHACGIDQKLTAFDSTIEKNFNTWLFRQHAGNHNRFTPEQIEWLRMIKDHIVSSYHLDLDDLDYTPFDAQGGRGKMYQLFGNEMIAIIDELNEVLVA